MQSQHIAQDYYSTWVRAEDSEKEVGGRMIDKEKLKKIVEHFGAYRQISKAVEELIELSEVLIKDINKAELDKDKLYEEMADVMIMLAQLRIIYNIHPEEIQEEINRKIERTMERIKSEPMDGVYYDAKGNLLGIDSDCAWK